MSVKKIFFHLVIAIMLLFFSSTFVFSYAWTVSKKTLMISFPGANPGLDPTGLLEESYRALSPLINHTQFTLEFPDAELIKGIEKVLSTMDNVIFVVHLDLPVYLRRLSPPEEIALESYSADVLKLIDISANKLAKIIKDYHKNNPDAMILAVSSAMGGEVLMRVLKNNANEIDSIVLYYPTMAMVKDEQFTKLFIERGYNKENFRIIAYDDDPTIPYIEKMYNDKHFDANFVVIKMADEAQGDPEWYLEK